MDNKTTGGMEIMKTKHLPMKVYKNGDYVGCQAIHIEVLNPEEFEFKLFTGFEDCHGEPIYEGDEVWCVKHNSTVKGVIIKRIDGMWLIRIQNEGARTLRDEHHIVSLTPPRENRRKASHERRELHRRDYDINRRGL
jgi:uncharacterized Zn ribbon protein